MSSNTRFALNTWYAVALVNDGNTLTLNINGEKDNSMTVAPYEYALYGVQIGMPSKGYQSSQLFYGRLSEMRLWTRPLSAREIKAKGELIYLYCFSLSYSLFIYYYLIQDIYSYHHKSSQS